MKILITPRSFALISKTPLEMLKEKGYKIIKNETDKSLNNREIVITYTPTANIDVVADLAFALMLALARRIPEADRETKAGNWKKFIGTSVWRKKLGVIGLGKIGRQVVKRVSVNFSGVVRRKNIYI